MAIARDSNTPIGFRGTGLTGSFSHTCSGSNGILFVFISDDTGDNTTTVTYNVVPMTQISKLPNSASGGELYVYALLNPSLGTNTVLITRTSQFTQMRAGSTSYTGVKQSGLPDALATNTATSTTITQSIVTIADNCAVIACASSGAGHQIVPSTNLVEQADAGTSGIQPMESSSLSLTPAGSKSFTANDNGGTSTLNLILVSIAPFIAPPTGGGFIMIM